MSETVRVFIFMRKKNVTKIIKCLSSSLADNILRIYIFYFEIKLLPHSYYIYKHDKSRQREARISSYSCIKVMTEYITLYSCTFGGEVPAHSILNLF